MAHNQLEKTISYYDEASLDYAARRYETAPISYIQYFFQRRLALLFLAGEFLQKNTPGGFKVLDIGCADGYVLRRFYEQFPALLSQGCGMDVSAAMIENAREKSSNTPLTYCLRGEEGSGPFDLVTRLGVHVVDLAKEVDYIKERLSHDGYFVFTISTRRSVHAFLKVRHQPYFADFKTFPEYEKILAESFDILKIYPYGFFIPKLWAFPKIARIVQPWLEKILVLFLPNYFHEKMYLLKRRG